MSVRVLSKVWDGFPRGGTELLALLALADWSDDEGRCYPSMSSIAKKIRLSTSQTRRAVHQLIDDDFVVVVGNKNGGAPGASRKYKINLTRLTSSIYETPSVDARASADAPDDLHTCKERASVGGSQTVIEPSIYIKDIFELPSWVPNIEWNAFVDHRKKLKKPLTAYSSNLAIKQLKKIVDNGHKPDDVINEAILRGWQSFFPPKGNSINSSNVMDGVS